MNKTTIPQVSEPEPIPSIVAYSSMMCPRCERPILARERSYITVIDLVGVTEEIHVDCLDPDDEVLDYHCPPGMDGYVFEGAA